MLPGTCQLCGLGFVTWFLTYQWDPGHRAGRVKLGWPTSSSALHSEPYIASYYVNCLVGLVIGSVVINDHLCGFCPLTPRAFWELRGTNN